MNHWIVLFVFFCLSLAPSHGGPTWKFGENSWLQLSFLGQVHYSFMDDAPDEHDFYLRRGRLILMGQVSEGIKFFVETDNDNFGKRGVSANTDLQDVFLDIQLGKSNHWVELGLILLPFSFEGTSSAVSLLGNDYNAEIMKLTNSFVWRDLGAMFHGHLGERFAYRVGAFDGYEVADKNPEAEVRLTGHVAYNLLGKVETGWFASQNRLPQESYLSVGLGFDSQGKATLDASGLAVDADAWVVDVQSAMVFSENSLTVNAGYYDWESAAFVGNTSFLEAGLTLGKAQFTGKWTSQDPDQGEELVDVTAGIFYFQKKHQARYGVEYRSGDSADWLLAGVSFFL